MSWVATDVTNTPKDSKIEFDVMSNNTLTNVLAITNSGLDTSAIATSWSLVDNNASALSFDSAGATGVLEIVTTNNSEHVKLQAPADAASNQVLVLQSGNRATPADDDEGYVSLYNDDSTGTQVEFSRMSWLATDVTNTTKDSKIEFDVMSNNTLTTALTIEASGVTTPGSIVFTGDITSSAAIDWDLIDNNASALSFDTTGKAGILELVTTDNAEGVDINALVTIGGGSALSADNTLIVGRAFTASASSSPAVIFIPAQTITEAASGTHTLISGLSITAPTITGGVATTTSTATVYISNEPTNVGTYNYALWVDEGDVKFDGAVEFDSTLDIDGAVIDTVTAATDWDLIDNNASALSFDTTGKAGILELVTTNSAEGADMNGLVTIGGGSALSVDNTLIVNRAFTASASSSPAVISISAQTITEAASGTHARIS